jgi:hypothetical protein
VITLKITTHITELLKVSSTWCFFLPSKQYKDLLHTLSFHFHLHDLYAYIVYMNLLYTLTLNYYPLSTVIPCLLRFNTIIFFFILVLSSYIFWLPSGTLILIWKKKNKILEQALLWILWVFIIPKIILSHLFYSILPYPIPSCPISSHSIPSYA